MKNYIIKIIVSTLLILLNNSTFARTQKTIYIYNDDGVSQESLNQTIAFFNDLANPYYIIKTINAESIKENSWVKHTALLVMPGGADIPYTQKLNGLGNQNIKNYVQRGGSYLGICAGAYYGAQFVEFDKGGPLEVTGERELQFFPGIAKGPAIAKYDYLSNSGARAANIHTKIDGFNKDINMFFNGGAYFTVGDSLNIKILGWYNLPSNKTLPAIIYIEVGKGQVILSGVHFEYNPKLLNKNDAYLKQIIPELNKSSTKKKDFTLKILQLLKLKQAQG